MLRRSKSLKKWQFPRLAGLSMALVLGGVLIGTASRVNHDKFWVPWGRPLPSILKPLPVGGKTTQVARLVLLSREARYPYLVEIAQGQQSPDREQARYLLASDLIDQRQGTEALPWLEGLERDYPVLAPYVALKQAQAYQVSGLTGEATAAWHSLLERYGDHPTAAEALFQLGNQQPQYWDQAIAQFPAHPRTVEIAQKRLAAEPKSLSLLLLVAEHGLYLPNYTAVLDQLVKEHSGQLKPADWETIGFGYWEHQLYGGAGAAYAKATATPENLWRAARGAQLAERTAAAIAGYEKLVKTFPNSPQAGRALLRLAALAPNSQAAIAYLDQAIAKFPEQAPDALLAKAKHLDALGSHQSATQARQMLMEKYPQADATAEWRWQTAWNKAKAGQIQEAWTWAQPITVNNTTSERAPEAAFWISKWASQLGQPQAAQAAFDYILREHPDSYYAWRVASTLGWPVGDFTTVRSLMPEIQKPVERPAVLAGSETLRELFALGQNWDTWTLWQVEFRTARQPSVAEQYTDGLIRLGIGDHLDGIYMLSSLTNRQEATEKEQVARLRQTAAYWQALYPFPFVEPIKRWSAERQLNPLLVTALIRQESRFMPGIRSVAGALGLMQVMPETADWIAQQIQLPAFKLQDPDDNIKLGTWYLDYTHREYDNHSLLAVASYNAGPGAVGGWLDRFGLRDPDAFVEQIPYSETQGYVTSVFGNYWNYLRLYNPQIAQQLAQKSPQQAVLALRFDSGQ